MPIKRILLTLFLLTLLGQKTFGQQNNDREWRGAYLGVGAGTWLHQDRNDAVPNPTVFTVEAGQKTGRFTYSFVADYIVNSTKYPMTIKNGNMLVSITSYSGYQFTFEVGNEIWRSNRLMIETVCGFGVGGFTYYKPDKYNQVSAADFVTNPGLSMKYLYGRGGFLQLKAQYNLANYKLDDVVSTNFYGNYFTIKLIIGSVGRGR